MKKIMLILVLTFSFASLSHGAFIYAASETAAVDAGNKFCPVSGDEVSDKVEKVEYHGKRYGLCCPMCAKKFLKDPEKYLAKLKG